jgi:hypothetical protein
MFANSQITLEPELHPIISWRQNAFQTLAYQLSLGSRPPLRK